MAGNETGGNPGGSRTGNVTAVALPKWSEAAEFLGKSLGAARILGVAVIFAMPDLGSGQVPVQMLVSAATDAMREALSNAVAPVIGADLSMATRKVMQPGGPV